MAQPAVDTPIANQVNLVNDTVNLDVSGNFSDADASDTGTWSYVSGLRNGTGLSFDPNTGELSGTPAAVDLEQDNTVVLRYTDGGGQTQDVTIVLRGSPQTGTGKNWGPSHGQKTQGAHAEESTSGQQAYQDSAVAQLDDLLFDPVFEFAIVKVGWAVVQPTTSTEDWEFIDRILDRCAVIGKRVIIQIAWDSSNNDNSNPTEGDPSDQLICPADLRASYTRQLSSGAQTFIHEVPVRNAMNATITAFGNRYNGHPQLEGLTLSESAPSWKGNRPAGYTTTEWANSLKSFATTAAAVLPQTNYFMRINSLSGEEVGLVEHAYQLGVGSSDPDLNASPGEEVFKGPVDGNPNAVRDYRGEIPYAAIASSPVLGRKDNELPISNLFQKMVDAGVTHMAWTEQDASDMDEPWASSEPDVTWASIVADIATYEGLGQSIITACPNRYTACNVV